MTDTYILQNSKHKRKKNKTKNSTAMKENRTAAQTIPSYHIKAEEYNAIRILMIIIINY